MPLCQLCNDIVPNYEISYCDDCRRHVCQGCGIDEKYVGDARKGDADHQIKVKICSRCSEDEETKAERRREAQALEEEREKFNSTLPRDMTPKDLRKMTKELKMRTPKVPKGTKKVHLRMVESKVKIEFLK